MTFQDTGNRFFSFKVAYICIKLFSNWNSPYIGRKITDLNVHMEEKMRLFLSHFNLQARFQLHSFWNVMKQKLMYFLPPLVSLRCHETMKLTNSSEKKAALTAVDFYPCFLAPSCFQKLYYSSFCEVQIISTHLAQKLRDSAGAYAASNIQIRRNYGENLNYPSYTCCLLLRSWAF